MSNHRAIMIDELDQMSRDFINGEVEPLKVRGLSLFDRWAVLTLASAYSLTKMGTISPSACAVFKYDILREYELFKTRAGFHEIMFTEHINRMRDYSVKRTELTKLLASGDADVIEMFVLSLQIIDLLTHEDIYLKLFQQKCNDKMFKAHALRTAANHIDEYREQFGEDIPYAKLLERFYAATCEDGIADLFYELDVEGFRDKARRAIPVKKDDYKDIAKAMRKMYVK